MNIKKEDKKAKKKNAFDAACDYLSISERSIKETTDKLLEKGYSEAEAAEAVQKLKDAGILDDHGYALRYIEYAIRKGRGMRRIKNELRQKGIDAFEIEDIMFELSESGVIDAERGRDRALEQAMKIVKGKEIDEKLIAKVARRLQTQGYEGDEVYFVLGRLRNMAKEEPTDGEPV